ncbi:MAG: hypothetical protein Q9196_005640 [Gyalolechia fulgens]
MPTSASTLLFPLDARSINSLSREDIVHAAKTAPILYQQGDVTIVRVHQDAVLKYGHGVHISEARNMRLVLESTDVRLPTVFDAWEVKDGNEETGFINEEIGYILMQYIEGDVLDKKWSGLDIYARQDIHSQLIDFLRQLHAIRLPVPGPLGGGLSRGPLFTDYGAGPFRSTEDLESWFDERLLVCQEFHRAPQTHPSFSGQFQNLVMCHMDIAPRNLILDRQLRVWVLDWAHAGGYPVYFEEAVLRRTGNPKFTEGLLRMLGEEHTGDVERLLAKFSSGLIKKTEQSLAEKAGHLEMLKHGKQTKKGPAGASNKGKER